MTKRLLLAMLLVVAALPLAGCGSKDDDYDPSKIAVKQPGEGPPPMPRPGDSKPTAP